MQWRIIHASGHKALLMLWSFGVNFTGANTNRNLHWA